MPNIRRLNVKEIYDVYINSSMSLTEVAKLYGLKGCTLTVHFRNAGLPVRARNATRQNSFDPEKLHSMYVDKKLSLEEIGKYFGVSSGTISRHLLSHGIQIREPHISRSLREGDYHLWSPEFKERAKVVLSETQCIKSAAEILNVNCAVLQLHNQEWKIVENNWKPEDKLAVKEMLEYTRNYQEVAQQFGVTRGAIQCLNLKNWRIQIPNPRPYIGKPTIGLDGYYYRSMLEAAVGNWLRENGITYTNEPDVCTERNWKADFKIGDYFVEVDGMANHRCHFDGEVNYDDGNAKILYYKENSIPYVIVNKDNYETTLAKLFLA